MAGGLGEGPAEMAARRAESGQIRAKSYGRKKLRARALQYSLDAAAGVISSSGCQPRPKFFSKTIYIIETNYRYILQIRRTSVCISIVCVPQSIAHCLGTNSMDISF
eukprot:6201575-Pleurochrysis_carterae.AAC.1